MIIEFPDYVKLKNEVEKLKTEISMLILEHDELLYVNCKNIEMNYMLSLGSLEYKAYELNCAVLRLKRKIELIQAKKNRQEKVIISVIEDNLDEEFAEYQRILEIQIDRMNSAIERGNGKVLSEEDTREIKKLYRAIVKILHPDLHPDITEAQIKLFHNAVVAYENCDLNTLRIINTMVSDPVLPDKNEDELSFQKKEKERLENLIKIINKRIEEIKSNYPYNVKNILEDEEKLNAKKTELENTIVEYKETISSFKQRIKEMLK